MGIPAVFYLRIPLEPVAYARARKRGKQHFTPAKQAKFMADVGMMARAVMAVKRLRPIEGRPVSLDARFVFTHPKSWSGAKKARTRWKTSKPDSDNLAKLLKDSLNEIVWKDDALVAEERIQKMYGPQPEIVINVVLLEGDAE
jgi:Holliday junction resolvase RusA-like endonuclease